MTALKEKFNNAEQLVAYCLKNFPETRGNDRTLWLKVADLQGFRLPKKLIPFFYKIFSFETIRRTRQMIQAGGMYLPEPFKVAERSLFAIEHREFHRKAKGESTDKAKNRVERPTDGRQRGKSDGVNGSSTFTHHEAGPSL